MEETKPKAIPPLTRTLAEFAASVHYADIPPAAVQRIKTSLLDSIGCCIFGATLPWTRKTAELARQERAVADATVFGMGFRTSQSLAALVNSTGGHAFELDDIHKESILHVGSIATPIALGMAEARGQSGKDVITSMLAGYEVGTRVGNAATTALFFRGFHPQGSSGVFAAAATAARALQLDAKRFQHALGIAGSQAGGLMAAQEGAMVKRFHSGRAAQSGVYSALLAAQDFTGITDVLEADYGGYLSTYSGAPNLARVTDGLGTQWEMLQVGYKPHASVTSIHTALDGLHAILQENRLDAADIARIHVGVSRMTHVHCAWPYKAQGVTAAQMNLFYGLAVIALDGVAFTSQFHDSRLSDPRILALIGRMDAVVDEEIDAQGPSHRHASRMRVETTDGRRFERLTLHRRGSPEVPLSPEEIERKFRHVVAGCIPDDAIDHIVKTVDRFETLDSTRGFSEFLGRSVAATSVR